MEVRFSHISGWVLSHLTYNSRKGKQIDGRKFAREALKSQSKEAFED